MAKGLTVKQAKLVKGIVQGKSKQAAALDAGYGTSLASAAAIAHETLKNPVVQSALHKALEKAGITPDQVVAPVVEALKHDDLDMRLKGHDRAAKIMQPTKSDTPNGNVFNFINNANFNAGKYKK